MTEIFRICTVHCPGWWPLVTCSYGALEVWLVDFCFVLFYLHLYFSGCMLFKNSGHCIQGGRTGENVLSSQYMTTTFIMCLEGETWSAWTACIRGMGPDVWEGFPEEITFEICQFCLELSLSKGSSKISMFGINAVTSLHPFNCACFLLSLGTLLPSPCWRFSCRKANKPIRGVLSPQQKHFIAMCREVKVKMHIMYYLLIILLYMSLCPAS